MRSSRLLARVVFGLLLVAAPGIWAADAPAFPAPAPATQDTSKTSGPPRDPVEVAADALVVRPCGLAATAVGAAVYLVALPFAAISGDVRETGRSLVGAPAKFTFQRRLGDFSAH